MSIDWPANSKVRFTLERLSVLTPRDRQGLAGRIGITQTDCKFVVKPTVYFPAIADKPELRLFRVDARHLELVESPPESAMPARVDAVENQTALANPSNPQEAAAPEGGGNLSQEDLDGFFD